MDMIVVNETEYPVIVTGIYGDIETALSTIPSGQLADLGASLTEWARRRSLPLGSVPPSLNLVPTRDTDVSPTVRRPTVCRPTEIILDGGNGIIRFTPKITVH